MTALKEELWIILNDLWEEEFKQLKWLLQQADIMHTIIPHLNYPAIPVTRLERADRKDTVGEMVQIYGPHGALEVTKNVLTKINRNDLVQRLSNITSAAEGDVGHVDTSSEKRGASLIKSSLVPLQQVTTDSQSEDLTVPVPKPTLITSFQQMLQSNLQNRFMCVQEGLSNVQDKKLLDDIYTELYITDGGDMQINKEHEVRQIEMASRKPAGTEVSIKVNDIFKHPSGKYRPIRTVLTNGIAGIGKTFLVHKVILDWAEGRANQDVHLLFPFTFRQLNLLKGKKFHLAKLIHKCIKETKDIKEEALNYIFTTLQMSGNTNYDKSKFKLLFVLDGLDENRLQLPFTAKEKSTIDVTKSTGVEGLLMNLIKGTLLPSARLWITTRPAAASQISLEFIDMVTEVRGFTDAQKEQYFIKRFSNDEEASKIISHIKTSRSLHIMCHIPVFCWITATVLEDVLQSSERGKLPRTLTEMYTEFLVFQMRRTKEKYGTKKTIRYIHSLAKLAFHQLEKGNLIFYEDDLRESGIHCTEASVYSGVFTQIFKKESWRKRDRRMFSFVHLSIQEFLAAFYVELSLINSNKNVMVESQTNSKSLGKLFSKTSATNVHRIAIDRALESPDGHLDLFLRFLLGLSLQSNQELLVDLLKQNKNIPDSNQETIRYIKEKIKNNLSAERCINLFHCLNELKDQSLTEEIQQLLNSQRYLSSAQSLALVFMLLSLEKQDDIFDCKKYCSSEFDLLRLLPAFPASDTYILSDCNLSEKSCDALASVLSSQTSNLRNLDLSNNSLHDSGVRLLSVGFGSVHCRLESLRLNLCKLSWLSCEFLASVLILQSACLKLLDLSDNDLQDSGIKALSAGLKSPQCRLETLRLSGCLVTEEGCAFLASALNSNPSHLKELDLSYNHPGDSGIKLLSAGLEDPNWRLDTLRVEPSGECWLKSGLRKYACQLTLDPNTAHKALILSDNNRKVTRMHEEQPYPDHPERFDGCFQLLCREGLRGRCYWEVEWDGRIQVAVTYKGISRSGEGADCYLGKNEKSWSLEVYDDGYSVRHIDFYPSPEFHPADSTRVAVYLDWPAGTLSFYRVSSDTYALDHLHTFHSRFTEPLYPAFWVGLEVSLVLCPLEEGQFLPV